MKNISVIIHDNLTRALPDEANDCVCSHVNRRIRENISRLVYIPVEDRVYSATAREVEHAISARIML